MKRWPIHGLRKSALYALLGSVATGLLTLLCYHFALGLGVAAPLFLFIVVLQSLTGDFLSAALVSGLAAACLDYFFAEPVLSFSVTKPSDALALASFLVTALVITQLVARLHREVQFTMAQKERLDRLYQLSQQLLSLEPEAAEEVLIEPFHRLFGVTAIALFDAETGESRIAGHSSYQLAERTRDAYIAGQGTSGESGGVSVRCLQQGRKFTGAIGFEGLQDPAETIGPLTALTSAHFEKIQAFRSASSAAAATQAEVYRSAILDALAHEFKTPLATILAAAGGLREAGSLGPEQLEMAETVESEAERLGRLTSRLLRVARLDREEVRPRIEILDVHSVVRHMVDQYARRMLDREISFIEQGTVGEEAADPELLRLALTQLLDNACKYSSPATSIVVLLQHDPDGFLVEVSNAGNSIPASEQRLIFERFHRGSDAKHHTSGSGLGLYVARKIAVAHGGTLYLVPEQAGDHRVAFRMKIPRSQTPSGHAVVTK